MKLVSTSPTMAGAVSFYGLILLLIMQLSTAASSQLRGPGKMHGSLLKTKDALASTDENAEDGAASAEATIEEAEKQAANQQATEDTAKADIGVANNMEDVAKTKPDFSTESTDVVKAKPASSTKSKDAATTKVAAGVTRRGLQAIKVTIVSAKGLKNQDAKKRGMTDPFCVCEVKGKHNAKVQTYPLDGTNGVHWDHVGTIHNFAMNDLLTCSVYDQDALPTDSDRFLGKTTVKGVKVLPGGFEGELPLASAGSDLASLKLTIVPLAMSDSNSESNTSSMEDALATEEDGEQESGDDAKDSSSEDDKDDDSEGNDSDSNDQDD